MKIVCDVDGVLLDFCGEVSNWIKASAGLDITSKPTVWSWGWDEETAHNLLGLFEKSKAYQNMRLMDLTAGTFLDWAADHHELWVISAAPENQEDERYENLTRLGLNIRRDRFRCMRDKVTFILNEVKPDVCIDDSPMNLEKFLEAGVTVWAPESAGYIPGDLRRKCTNYRSLAEMVG